jgi:hypothetical protein
MVSESTRIELCAAMDFEVVNTIADQEAAGRR